MRLEYVKYTARQAANIGYIEILPTDTRTPETVHVFLLMDEDYQLIRDGAILQYGDRYTCTVGNQTLDTSRAIEAVLFLCNNWFFPLIKKE